MRRQPPADDSILCEKCGYILDNLPVELNCPECGKPVRESAEGLDRRPPIVEREGASIRTRVLTMFDVVAHPYSCFRTFAIASHPYQRRFKWHMMILSSLLFGLSGGLHARWILWFFGWDYGTYPRSFEVFALLVFSMVLFVSAVVFIVTLVTEQLVAYFTAIEGRFWGYRLRKDVVRRVLSYHIAHLVPISFITLVIVSLNLLNSLNQTVRGIKPIYYLYALCAWVLVAAFWLMSTYVSAMRAVMFANRPMPPEMKPESKPTLLVR
ncbi:MAG TPA: hypothetical protein PK402_12455, partial [Tepidisphaeraceae bacterium]|nr:hypothetical protein [Tepidisphaeraceae bacterium]